MSNKKDNKLDFRNVKNTQFDSSQTNKMAFSELQSAYRHYETNAILKDAYTHFIQELNGSNLPTKVTYYQASAPARDRINVRADSSGDLAGTYFSLQEFITKKNIVFWFNVSGVGTAPGIGDQEVQVDINTNDPASVVAFAVKSALKASSEFIVIGSNLLSSYVDIEYFQFGETQAINTGTSGFLSNRLVEGQSFEVGEIELTYSGNNPIYNGNVLTGLKFNPYTASFDVVAGAASTIQDSDGHELNINPDGSINTVSAKGYDRFNVTARDTSGNITQVEYFLGATLVKTVDIVYDIDGHIVSYTES